MSGSVSYSSAYKFLSRQVHREKSDSTIISHFLFNINPFMGSLKICLFSAHYAPVWGFPKGSASKESVCNQDLQETQVLGSERSPGGGHGNPLQCSCLENPMDRGAWWAAVLESQSLGHDWVTDTHTHAPGYPYILMEKESSIFLSTYWSSSPHPAWQSDLWFVYFGASTCCLRVCSQTSTLI